MLLAVEIDDFPIQPVKLIKEEFLNMVAFIKLDVRWCFIFDHNIPTILTMNTWITAPLTPHVSISDKYITGIVC